MKKKRKFNWKIDQYAYLRGLLRRSWNRHISKLRKIQNNRKKLPLGVNDKMVWTCQCNICKKDFRQNQIQVDHIIPCGSLLKKEDIQGFVERLLLVQEENLQILCKACHNLKSLSDSRGITFEEAIVVKQLIEFGKLKAAAQVEELISLGFSAEEIEKVKNKIGRTNLYKKTL